MTQEIINDIPNVDGEVDVKPAKKSKATAKADVTPVVAEREFKTPTQVAAAFSALSGLLTEDQKVIVRRERGNVGGKMAAGFLLGIAPKA